MHAESGSSDRNTRQVLTPGRRNRDGLDEHDCMTLGRTSAIVLMGSLGSITVLLLLLCQLGVFGSSTNDRPSMSHNDIASSVSSNCSDGLPECNVGVGSRYACKSFYTRSKHMPIQH